MTRLVVATRSADKLREIRQLLAGVEGLEVVDLDSAGVAEEREEDGVEIHDTFRDNALAKARYYSRRAGALTLADDSGLCVDALDGGTGVYSKRFSGRTDLKGVELDRANNALLLERLRGVPTERRGAHYVCAIALVDPRRGREALMEGSCHGLILESPRGTGGFGYDPLFYLSTDGATFGELPSARKNEVSHRAEAVRAAGAILREWG